MKYSRVFPAELPYDVIFNILTRLPVKSLLRFRSVCTLWGQVVSDPGFVQTHLQLANTSTLTHKSHMVMTTFGLDNLPRYIESISYETRICTRLDFPFGNRSRQGCEILASCNGLFVVGRGERSYFLWNPLTRVYRDIPGQLLLRDAENTYKLYGLGVDVSSNCFKVLRVVRKTSSTHLIKEAPRNCGHFFDLTLARLYSSDTNSWRTLTEDFPYYIFNSKQAVVVNGYPHYVVIRGTKEIEREPSRIDFAIICFDFNEEKFKEVATPSNVDCETEFRLGCLEGSLCLVIDRDRHRLKSVVWVMKEYGVKESWTQLPINQTHIQDFVPLEWTYDFGDCSLIVGSGKTKLLYGGTTEGFDAVSYVESLVSPSIGEPPGGELVRY